MANWEDKFRDNLLEVLYRPDQPRDEKGRWTSGGSGGGGDGKFVPAKTVGEAENILKERGVEYSYYGEVSEDTKLKYLNAHSQALTDLEQAGIDTSTIGRHISLYDEELVPGLLAISGRGVGGDWGYAAYVTPELQEQAEAHYAENLNDLAKGDIPTSMQTSSMDTAIHEMGHNLRHQLPEEAQRRWEEYYHERGAWTALDDVATNQGVPAPSFWAQESASELFAESLVAYVRGVKCEAVDYLGEMLTELGFKK